MQIENQNAPPCEDMHPQANKSPKNLKKELLSWILMFAEAAAIVFLVTSFLFAPVLVAGASMRDTLADGELMFVSKLDYLIDQPQSGDVVICKYPGRSELFVKRLIGEPGDVISVQNNVVYRNGEALPESYLTESRNSDGFSMMPFILGENEYFVMGDNRDNSHDSRNYYGYDSPAALTREQIIGHVRFILFPLSSIRSVQ